MGVFSESSRAWRGVLEVERTPGTSDVNLIIFIVIAITEITTFFMAESE